MKILKKISVATVVDKPKSFFKEVKESTPLMRVFGIAKAYELGMSIYGEFFKFKGEFQAVDLETGELSISSVCFLPQPIDVLLKSQIDALGNDGKAPVEFAFDISVVPDIKSEVGFQYRVKTLRDSKLSDPLESLAKEIAAIALPTPKEAAADAPEVPADTATTETAVNEVTQTEKVATKPNKK